MAQIAQNIGQWFHRQLVVDKLNNPLGLLLCLILGAVLALIIGHFGIKAGAVLLVLVIGTPLVVGTMFNSFLGVALAITIGTLVPYIGKYSSAPVGISLDAMLFVLFFGLILQQVYKRDWSFIKNPLAPWVMVWMGYNLLQVLNPWAGSRLAWVYTVRSMAGLILLFFIASYAFTNLKKIKFIIEWIIGIALVSALYGLKQEYFGFTQAELNWLYSDPERFQLIFQWSRLRVFSFFSDPTNYGILMAYMANFCIVLATGKVSLARRMYLLFAAMCMFMAIGYAGSRTPIVLIPFGLMIYVLLTLKKEVIIGGMVVLMLGGVAMMKSTSNAVLFRIQSAFNLKDSGDTIGVRMRNQEFIQPYIHTHPFGFGMGSTGMWGKRFTPDSFLADFAHDSGFVRVAVEQGWIGLIIICGMLFTVLRLCIYYYIRVRDPYIKQVYLALNVVFFMLILANYPQEALVILPTSLIFYTFLAIMVRMKDYDPAFAKKEETDVKDSQRSSKALAPANTR